MTDPPRATGEGPRALVFGGLGFLGRHIAAGLRGAGLTVTVTSRHPDQRGVVRCDPLRDPARNLAAMIDAAGPEVLVNAAGATTGDVAAMVDANVTATARLLAAVAVAAPQARFIQLGSAGEYGPTEPGHPLSEDEPCAPTSPYAVSKLAGTLATLALSADAGIDAVVLRVFNPIGAGCPPSSMAGRAARLLSDAVRVRPQRDITMASLDSHRDWVDARDVGGAVAAVARTRGVSRLYNVGSGQAVVSREVVRLIAVEAGFTAIIHEDRAVPDRSGAVSWQQADISLAERELGWRPRHVLAESVSELCRSLR